MQGTKGYKVVRYHTVTLSCSSVRTIRMGVQHETHAYRNFDLLEASEKHINADYLKGLINVVPSS